MPTYEYRCPQGHNFELFQKMSEEPRAQCPECGAESERLLSGGAGFLFKGNGFYITDYRSESYKKAASKEAGVGGSESDSAAPPKKEGSPSSAPGTGSDAKKPTKGTSSKEGA